MNNKPSATIPRITIVWLASCLSTVATVDGQTELAIEKVLPGKFKALTEPPCSYCSTQHRKGLILGEDRVLAWLRATHNLFDGKTYQVTELPIEMSAEAKRSMSDVDSRLRPLANVYGVEFKGGKRKAYALDQLEERACILDEVGEEKIAVLWYAPTKSAVAFSQQVGDQTLTLYADKVSPDSAPFKDKETGTRWTIAGRAVDGPLKGKELKWVEGTYIQVEVTR